MLFLNFLCPTSSEQFGRVAELCNLPLTDVRIADFNLQIDFRAVSSDEIVARLLKQIGLGLAEFRRHDIVVALPRHPLVGNLLVTVLHGLCGRLPRVLNVDTRSDHPRIVSIVDLEELYRDAHRPTL